MECGLCARRHPLDAKKCHPCNNTDLRQLYCTCALRVSVYMEVLRKEELWGTSAPLESLAATEIRSRMSCAHTDVKHNCDAGLSCPLIIQIAVVGDRFGTDVLMAAQMGAWSVWCKDGVTYGVGEHAERSDMDYRGFLAKVEVAMEKYLRETRGIAPRVPEGWE